MLQGVARVDDIARQYELVRFCVLQCVAVWLECSSELLSFSSCEYKAVGCSVMQVDHRCVCKTLYGRV